MYKQFAQLLFCTIFIIISVSRSKSVVTASFQFMGAITYNAPSRPITWNF